MCQACWEEHGSPTLDTPAIREAARLMEAVYDYSVVGGNLHITLDDFGITDANLDWLESQRLAGGWTGWGEPERHAEQIAAESACLRAMRALTVPERASALALFDGYWTPTEAVAE